MIKLGVYAYEQRDQRLLELIETDRYVLEWRYHASQHESVMRDVLECPVDVLVVNSFHERGLPVGYRDLVPDGTRVVVGWDELLSENQQLEAASA